MVYCALCPVIGHPQGEGDYPEIAAGSCFPYTAVVKPCGGGVCVILAKIFLIDYILFPVSGMSHALVLDLSSTFICYSDVVLTNCMVYESCL